MLGAARAARAREPGRRPGAGSDGLDPRGRRLHHLRPHDLQPDDHPPTPHRVRHPARLRQHAGGGQRPRGGEAERRLRDRPEQLAGRELLLGPHVGGDAAGGPAGAARAAPARAPVQRPRGAGAAAAAAHGERSAEGPVLGGQRQAVHRPVRGRAPGRHHPRSTGARSSASTWRTTTAASPAGAGRRSPRRRSPSGRRTPARGCPASRSACG